jgi:hypothetical protein
MGRKSLTFTLLPPLLCLGLLGGMLIEQETHVTPEDAEPYHERARLAVADSSQFPIVVGNWVSRDEPTIEAAERLLRPNVIITRRFLEPHSGRSASLMIVQTRDTRDMEGHYPPVCYPSHGMVEVYRERQQWRIGSLDIDGVEYHFERTAGGQAERQAIYNFMILPRTGITSDMRGLNRAAKNHQLRYFGAAQVQVLMPADWPKEQRDEIFTTLITATEPILLTLLDGESL